MSFQYDSRVLRQLADHGLRPTHATAPERVRGWLNDLYRYEIRRLRERFVRGGVLREDYVGLVTQLRDRYWLLGLPVVAWGRTENT
jgi:hypothetical protein